MVYTIDQLPAFRSQIIANLFLTHRTEGGISSFLPGSSQRFEIVTYVTNDGSFVAAVVDIAASKIILAGDPEADLGFAIFKLFQRSSEGVTRVLEDQLRGSNHTSDQVAPIEEKAKA